MCKGFDLGRKWVQIGRRYILASRQRFHIGGKLVLVHDSSWFKDTMLSMVGGYGKDGKEYMVVVPPPQVARAPTGGYTAIRA